MPKNGEKKRLTRAQKRAAGLSKPEKRRKFVEAEERKGEQEQAETETPVVLSDPEALLPEVPAARFPEDMGLAVAPLSVQEAVESAEQNGVPKPAESIREDTIEAARKILGDVSKKMAIAVLFTFARGNPFGLTPEDVENNKDRLKASYQPRPADSRGCEGRHAGYLRAPERTADIRALARPKSPRKYSDPEPDPKDPGGGCGWVGHIGSNPSFKATFVCRLDEKGSPLYDGNNKRKKKGQFLPVPPDGARTIKVCFACETPALEHYRRILQEHGAPERMIKGVKLRVCEEAEYVAGVMQREWRAIHDGAERVSLSAVELEEKLDLMRNSARRLGKGQQ